MSENQPQHVRKDKRKKPYNDEIIFKNKVHMQAYLVDKLAQNKNKRFNITITLT